MVNDGKGLLNHALGETLVEFAPLSQFPAWCINATRALKGLEHILISDLIMLVPLIVLSDPQVSLTVTCTWHFGLPVT